MKYLMGIDNGGTFAKAALFDEMGRQISMAKALLPIITPQDGYMERDMNLLWEKNQAIIRECILKSQINPKDIRGISFSGHGKGLYLMGENAPAYHGILSTDTRGWEYIQRWKREKITQRVYEKTYQDILACQPVTLLAWFKENKPHILEKTKYIFSVKDFIRYQLTGVAGGEYTDFTGGNLINMNTLAYDKELMGYFGLEEMMDKLPPLYESKEICGYVSQEASASTLLPEGLPVVAGMFDINACGIATGLVDEQQLCMIAGTWSINEYIAKEPIKDGSIMLNSRYCMPTYYLIEESSPTSASNMEWFMQQLMADEYKRADAEGRSVYDIGNEWVASLSPDRAAPIFLPFLNGSSDNPLARGSFIGLSSCHTKKHMLQAVYEGIVFSHKNHLERLLVHRPSPPFIRLAGGASRSDVWVQMFADILQIPIDRVEDKELGAQGAAMVAGIGVGIYKDYQDAVAKTVRITERIYPRSEYARIYEEKYKQYKRIVHQLAPIW